VIRADTLEALFDIAAILSTQPLPKGPRVGVVSNAGGAAVLFADACDAQGLKLAALQTATIEKLNERLKLNSVITNPVDLTASGSLDHLEYAIGVVGNDQNVDSLVVIHAPPIADGSSQAAAAITRGAVEIRPTKPVVAVFQSIGSLAAKAGSESIPTYAFPENPAMALGAAWRYAQWCNGPRGSVHTLSRFAHETVRAVVDRAASESGGGGMLSPEDVATILRAAAITISQPEDSTGSRDRPSNHRQPPSGILMFAEVTIDSTFGPLIACGFGGAIAELVGDITFRLYPLTDLDAAEMINSLKANKLLEGYPDQPPADRKALTDLLVRVSALIETIPEMTELELNPIYIQPAGKGAIVHHARIQIESPRPPES
ncbi:MAG TPA: acetate--CoA ligase family protein, partial [Candidatus Binataceae bacterium]|nr:acetate--CoA ligase family protein [Candidatus Binataceae bacterium]